MEDHHRSPPIHVQAYSLHQFLKVLGTGENDSNAAGSKNDTWLGSCQFDSNMKSSIQIQMKSEKGQDTKVRFVKFRRIFSLYERGKEM